MGYYTYIKGEIDYSDVSKEKQEVIEKVYDVIELMHWYCSASYRENFEIKYYDKDLTEWMHYLWVKYDKDKKVIDFSCDRKDYYESTATFLSLIAPYLNENKTYEIEYYGEDQSDYDEETDEFIPDVSKLTIKNNVVYDNGEIFQTNNKLTFPFPNIKPRIKLY